MSVIQMLFHMSWAQLALVLCLPAYPLIALYHNRGWDRWCTSSWSRLVSYVRNGDWLLNEQRPKIVTVSTLDKQVHERVVTASTNCAAPGADADVIYRPEVMKTIEAEIDRLNPTLRDLSLKIHGKPELKFQENFAHDTLTSFMKSQGFTVMPHYKSDQASDETPKYMTTAWRAEYNHASKSASATGRKRVLGINSEMDALPIPKGQVNHACGHNLIAMAGVAVALAVKKALEVHDLAGSVVLLGTPAEEGGHGKVRLIKMGAYKEMDACVMCHPSSGSQCSVMLGSSLAIQAIRVCFKGRPAHASLQPWEGINAQDAVMLAYNAVSMLRQQIRPDLRVHGVVRYEKIPLPANVIPEQMPMIWNIRAPTGADLEALRKRVIACFEGVAIATGCTADIVCKTPILNLNQNSVLAQEFSGIAKNRLGMSLASTAEDNVAFSTDFGNVTHELPAIHPGYSIPTEKDGRNHTPGFTAAAASVEGHEATLKVAKALALTGFRVLDDDAFYHDVKAVYDTTR